MVELNSVSLISGVMFGVQHEELDDENYLIIALGIFEIILVW